MIISRTPVRISFCGGGTDIPAYYEQYGPGMVVNATINKYIHVLVHKRFDEAIRFTSFKEEVVDKVEKMEEGIVKTVLQQFGIKKSIDLIAVSDVPPGTGMGSSGAFTVGLLKALQQFVGGQEISSTELADLACEIEIDRLQQPVGKQDQYAAACGGFAVLEFAQDGTVSRKPLAISETALKKIEAGSMIFFLNKQRSASAILKEQVANIKDRHQFMAKIQSLVPEVVSALQAADMRTLGAVLDESWQLKKQLAEGISDDYIDDLYHKAKSAGAYGGKVLGAGGGGFLFIAAEPEKREALKMALGLDELSFAFEFQGSILLSA